MHFSVMFQPMSLNSKNRTIDNGPNVSKITFKFEITVPLTAAETRMHQKTAPIVKHRIICFRSRRFNWNFMIDFDWRHSLIQWDAAKMECSIDNCTKRTTKCLIFEMVRRRWWSNLFFVVFGDSGIIILLLANTTEIRLNVEPSVPQMVEESAYIELNAVVIFFFYVLWQRKKIENRNKITVNTKRRPQSWIELPLP